MPLLGRTLRPLRAAVCARLCGAARNSGLSYIDARQTLAAAAAAGHSVGDYVEALWSQPGGSQRVIDQIAATGVFDAPRLNVVEIGAGTGRYLDKTLKAAAGIERYESYETDAGWSAYLARTWPVIAQPADGASLAATGTGTVDLVTAHGVFVYLPLLVAVRYLREVGRVCKPGALFAADFYTEQCFTSPLLDAWLASGHNYPVLTPVSFLLELMEVYGFAPITEFFNPHGAGQSHYFCFRKVTSSGPD
jgi:SAM-dependent methyltransferase